MILWKCLYKEDTASPTVSTKDVILKWMIDTMEDRDAATDDIPGSFLKITMKKEIYVSKCSG